LEVIFQCQRKNNEQRPSIIIASVQLLFEIERDLIERNFGKERYIPFLVTEAKRLERSGVDFLVMPCNSLHVFINEIRAAVSIPVLSIVEETIKYLNDHRYKKVGLISTSATITNRVYETAFSENGLSFVTPNDLQRAQMDKIIQRLIAGQHLNSDRELIHGIIGELSDKDIDAVALACTDLQLLLPNSNNIPVFDTMKVFAEATVANILS